MYKRKCKISLKMDISIHINLGHNCLYMLGHNPPKVLIPEYLLSYEQQCNTI
jgi:hypothetical protein